MGSDNMRIYERVRSVPPEAQKPFNNGSFSGTDINPMWRIKTLTEVFGPVGSGWYYDIVSERSETYGNTVMAIVDIDLYVMIDGEWSKPIRGTGGNTLVKETRSGIKTSDEGYKMALTDALSVACKALGIGADVYFAKDRTKYTPPDTCLCADCGKRITDSVDKKGKPLPAIDIAQTTFEKFGRQLCVECAKKSGGG